MQSTPGPAASRPPMVVIAVAIVLALIGIGGIAVGVADNDDDKKNVASNGTTTTTDNGGFGAGDAGGSSDSTAVTTLGTTPTTGKAGTTATTAKTGGTTPTTVTAACPNPPAATADPGAHQPPALGTFTYASCSDSADARDTKIAAGTSGNGVTRRTVSSSEQEFGQTATIAYGPSGVLLEGMVAQSPQGNFTCDWKPDVVNYPASLSVGAQWNTKSSCDLKQSSGASPGRLNLDASGKVTGKVAYTVGSTTVNAWIIEATIKLTTTITAFGSTTATITQRSYYDPAHGLDVYRHSESQTQQGNIIRDERLVSLTPKTS